MTTALASAQGQLNPLKSIDPKQILERYLSDENTKEIAQSYGVTRQALGQYLLKTAEAEWKEAQVARAIARKETAEDDMDAISSQISTADKEQRERLTLTLSLARERLKAAQWDLERVCRRIYGQDNQASDSSRIAININLGHKGDAQVGQVIDVTTNTADSLSAALPDPE